jgi:alanine racemase
MLPKYWKPYKVLPKAHKIPVGLYICPTAVRHNVSIFKSINHNIRIASVVKANAYGHGLANWVACLAPICNHFYVIQIQDALVIREMAPQADISILQFDCTDTTVALATTLKLCLVITNINQAIWLDTLPIESIQFRWSVFIQSGLTREGLYHNAETEPILQKLYAKQPWFRIVTHFSQQFSEGTQPYTPNQYSGFVASLRQQYPNTCLSTMATEGAMHLYYSAIQTENTMPEEYRIGMGLYGFSVIDSQKQNVLLPALYWSVQAQQIYPVSAGEWVGYGSVYQTPHPGYIAVLPVGYYNGVPSVLGLQVYVQTDKESAHGKSLPIVGKVMMNHCCVFSETPLPDHTVFYLLHPKSPFSTIQNWVLKTNSNPYVLLSDIKA